MDVPLVNLHPKAHYSLPGRVLAEVTQNLTNLASDDRMAPIERYAFRWLLSEIQSEIEALEEDDLK